MCPTDEAAAGRQRQAAAAGGCKAVQAAIPQMLQVFGSK